MFSEVFIDLILDNKIMRIMPEPYQHASVIVFETVLEQILEENKDATISELYVKSLSV